MSPTTEAPPAAGDNLPKFDALLAQAEQFGMEEAKGKDVQIKFDLTLVQAAHAGVIDRTKDKHGDGIDDAVKLSAAYFTGRNKTVIFDHKEPRQRKLASTSRKLIELGGSAKYGVNEPMTAVNTLITLWQKLRANPSKGQKLDDAHNTLMRFARDQLKRDTIIPDGDLARFCYKPVTETRSAEDWFRSVIKQANQLKTGKLSNCPELDNSAELQTIAKAANAWLSRTAKERGAKAAA